MSNLTNKTLESTALWVAACRFCREDISMDKYSKYWVTPETLIDHKNYLKEVGPHENECVSLRFRYILDTVRDWIGDGSDTSVINIAAGLSSLCVLLPKSIKCIELDQPNVIRVKKNFYNNIGRLDVHLEKINLNNLDEISLFLERLALEQCLKSKKIVLILEGIIYYLDKKVINFIFEQISRLPNNVDILVIINIWPKKLKSLPVFDKFIKYSKNNVSNDDFSFMDSSEVKIEGFDLREVVDYSLLYKKYLNSDVPEDDVFYEELVVLERSSAL